MTRNLLVAGSLLATLVPGRGLASPDLSAYPWFISRSPVEVCVSISESPNVPYQGHVAPWTGDKSFYIWTQNCVVPSSGSEFSLVGDLEVVDLIPMNGVVNLGTNESPILRYPECFKSEPVAEVVLRDAAGAGGQLCFAPSHQNEVNCSLRICDEYYASHIYYGLSSVAAEPCTGWDELDGCYPVVSVDSRTWGRVKAIYR
jgi:hypothetical protein